MVTVQYTSGDAGYVWPNPPKKPTEFHISLHWPDRCSTTKWWGKLSTPNAFGERNRGYHSHQDDKSELCKSLFILGVGLDIIVIDDGIEHICEITKIHRRRCQVIVIAKIKEIL